MHLELKIQGVKGETFDFLELKQLSHGLVEVTFWDDPEKVEEEPNPKTMTEVYDTSEIEIIRVKDKK